MLDFSSKQGDRIDDSAFDANAQMTGDQAFQVLIGQDAFTAAARSNSSRRQTTRWSRSTGQRAAGAEMRIEIEPVVNFQATDSSCSGRRAPTQKGPAHARPHHHLRLRRPARAEPADGAALLPLAIAP